MKIKSSILFSFLLVCLFILNNTKVLSQTTGVGINSTGDKPNGAAMLDVKATDKGVLIPRMSTIQRASIPNLGMDQKGLFVFDNDLNQFYYWDGTQWVSMGSACTTLQKAYDGCNGNASGDSITISKFGKGVQIYNMIAGDAINKKASTGLTITADKNFSTGLWINQSNNGAALVAKSTSTTTGFSTIQSEIASNDTSAAAIGASTSGNSAAIFGQVANNNSKAKYAIYGVNQRTDGGSAIRGNGFGGIFGEGILSGIIGSGSYGVLGYSTDLNYGSGICGYGGSQIASNGVGVGVEGHGFYGIYGETSVATSIWENDNDNPKSQTTAQYSLINSYGVYGKAPIDENNVPYGNGIMGDGFYGVVGYGIPSLGGCGLLTLDDIASCGTKSFRIDHPLDPKNKYLKHFAMESNEVLNVYRGNVTLDNNGEAVVTLPDYFNEINVNFSYNLTPIGDLVAICVKEKIKGNQFVIKGAKPGIEVSWTLYAERNDLYLQKYPERRNAEVSKSIYEKGHYQLPELYNASENEGIFKRINPSGLHSSIKAKSIFNSVKGNSTYNNNILKQK